MYKTTLVSLFMALALIAGFLWIRGHWIPREDTEEFIPGYGSIFSSNDFTGSAGEPEIPDRKQKCFSCTKRFRWSDPLGAI